MFNKDNWAYRVNKTDLKYVIINGLIAAILAGVLGGAIDYFLGVVNVPIRISLILLACMIGWRVRKAYEYYHISFSVLAIVFMVIGLFSVNVTEALLTCYLAKTSMLTPFLNPFFYISYLIEPFIELYLAIITPSAIGILYAILNIACYSIAFYLVYRYSKPRR